MHTTGKCVTCCTVSRISHFCWGQWRKEKK